MHVINVGGTLTAICAFVPFYTGSLGLILLLPDTTFIRFPLGPILRTGVGAETVGRVMAKPHRKEAVQNLIHSRVERVRLSRCSILAASLAVLPHSSIPVRPRNAPTAPLGRGSPWFTLLQQE